MIQESLIQTVPRGPVNGFAEINSADLGAGVRGERLD